MIGHKELAERLEPNIGFPLASAMAENQKLLATAEQRVNGDIQRACDLVEIENCEQPSPSPVETRMAAYVILLTAQKEWFGEACTSPDGAECYTLANVTESGLVLMRHQSEEVTLLHAAPSSDRQVRVSKTRHNIFENQPYKLPITPGDRRVMTATTRRLLNVNLKWRRLMREHRFTPPRDQSRVPLPRTPSQQS